MVLSQPAPDRRSTALHRLAPLRDFDLVLTDAKASDRALAEMRELGVRHEVVP